jgi:hypothetical protein
VPRFGERKLSTNWLNDEDTQEENTSNKKEAAFGSQGSNDELEVKIDISSSLSEQKLHTKSEIMIDTNNLLPQQSNVSHLSLNISDGKDEIDDEVRKTSVSAATAVSAQRRRNPFAKQTKVARQSMTGQH